MTAACHIDDGKNAGVKQTANRVRGSPVKDSGQQVICGRQRSGTTRALKVAASSDSQLVRIFVHVVVFRLRVLM